MLTDGRDVVPGVGQPGHHHEPRPDRRAPVGQAPGELQGRRQVAPGHRVVDVRQTRLDVEEHQVGVVEHGVGGAPAEVAGGVQRGVHADLLGTAQHARDEGRLQQRLAAGDRQPTAAGDRAAARRARSAPGPSRGCAAHRRASARRPGRGSTGSAAGSRTARAPAACRGRRRRWTRSQRVHRADLAGPQGGHLGRPAVLAARRPVAQDAHLVLLPVSSVAATIVQPVAAPSGTVGRGPAARAAGPAPGRGRAQPMLTARRGRSGTARRAAARGSAGRS